MERRSFLKTVGGAVGTSAIGVGAMAQGQQAATQEPAKSVDGFPMRVLGRTGEKISIIGYPGLALREAPQEECTASLHEAFDKGLNYFDVAPAYGRDGICEVRMGEGLQGIDRSKYFLSCKTKMRDAEGCKQELDRSLKRLKTDHFDLYQLHCLQKPEEVKQALGPGGAMETILEAQKEGKVRFIGFSAHTTKAAVAALNGFKFDTAMFPISFVEYFILGFGKPVLELACEREAAVLAIKPMCLGAWPKDVERTRKWWYRTTETEKDIDLALRFTLSLDPVVAGIPPGWMDLAAKAIDVARSYRPITKPETEELQKMAQNCESIFRREEDRVAYGCKKHGPVFPDCPHDCFA